MSGSVGSARQGSLTGVAAKKPKSRSGTQWTDADYDAAGWERPTIRLLKDDVRKLDAMAKSDGESRSSMLARLIQKAWSERQ